VQQLIDKKTTLICISNAMPQGYSIKESIEKDAFIGIYRIRLVANII
jgi:hypothetical protein